MSRAFVVNSGSSSIKYQLIDLVTNESVMSGLIERIGETGGDAINHTEGIRSVLDMLGDDADISVVGHRVVHGGDRFDRATVITDEVLADIEALSPLAPLHNPANLAGIHAARDVLGFVPHVAVFDTAFHQSMPAEAYTYAIDADVAAEYGVRKYGFHGTSVRYVSRCAAEFLGRDPESTNLIVLHLGNGSSVTAVHAGRSVDTSMGLTPLQGLVMGTRTGDIDASVVAHLSRVAGMSIDDIDNLLNMRSGILGLTGMSDMRDVEDAVATGDERARIGLSVWRHRIRHYLGAYIAQLGRVDAIVFTAGIGENSSLLREMTCQGMEHLGIELDSALNDVRSKVVRDIATESSAVRVLVVPTNEELEIAQQALAAV
ncbi:MAG: acetate/propionate family kinase [Microbacteriaceae bacterium]